jgi:hypothetical protein
LPFPAFRRTRSLLTSNRHHIRQPDAAWVNQAREDDGRCATLRRALLVGVTALLVARPLVPGEDPGLLSDPPRTADLWMTQCWLVLAAALVAGQVLLRRGGRYLGWPEAFLLLAVGAVVTSAVLAARYRHPAWIVTGDWLGFLMSFVVVRQLAVGESEQGRLFAALQATAAAVGVYVIALRLGWFPRAPNVYATADSRAACLALLLPLLAFGVIAARGARWPTVWAAVFLGFGVVGLWLTGSEAAVAGVVLVSAVAGLTRVRRLGVRRTAAVTAVAAVVFGLAGLVGYTTGWLHDESGRFAVRTAILREGWRVTDRMLTVSGSLGVGPGNFGRIYPLLMGPAGDALHAPRNFALELLATAGPALLAGVLGVLAIFFFKTVRLRGASGREAAPPASAEPSPVGWEFYLGGALGLILGSLPRLSDASAGVVLVAGAAAAYRSVAWFVAFAMFERLPTTGRGRALALAAGVAALMIALFASDGIGFTSVAGLLWPVLALGLNSADFRPAGWTTRNSFSRVVLLPLVTVAAILYFVSVSYAVTAARVAVYRATGNGSYFLEQVAARPDEWPPDRSSAAVRTQVIAPLERARSLDPGNARWLAKLAEWRGRLWAVEVTKIADTKGWDEAFALAAEVARLDPDGLEAPQAQVTLFHVFARVAEELAKAAQKKKDDKSASDMRKVAREQYQHAAEVLQKVVARIPNDPRLRFALTQELVNAGDQSGLRREAAETLRVDHATRLPWRRLSDQQRQQVEIWLGRGKRP